MGQIAESFLIALLFFTLVFVLNWIRLRQQVRPFRKYGLAVGAVLILFEVVSVVLSSEALRGVSIFGILLADAWAFIRLAAFTIVGTYYAWQSGHLAFPLLMRRFPVALAAQDAFGSASPAASTPALQPPPIGSSLDGMNLTPPVVDEATPETIRFDDRPPSPAGESSTPTAPAMETPSRPGATPSQALGAALIVVAGALLYTVVLFTVTTPRLSQIVRSLTDFDTAQLGLGSTVTLATLLLVLEVGFTEEIIFRLGIQNFLAVHFKWQGPRFRIAIVVTAVLWAMGHSGLLDPDWVKLAQIFPVGLALGWLYDRFGIESAILAHGLFNVAGLVLAPGLIS